MKIGIVNDVAMVIEALKRAVALQPRHRVLWTTQSGAEAVELCAKEPPDVVLMDLLMPGMDGVEATRRIMTSKPCAILLVTVSVGANSWRVFEAMGHGALDVVDTPTLGAGNAQEAAAPLLRKIMNIGWLIGDKGHRERSAPGPARSSGSRQGLIAIGSSAGGPAALEVLLKGLPRDFSPAIVLVQHVDQVFAAGMAEWLGSASGLNVRLAQEGETPQSGTVLLAGTNHHIRLLKNGTLTYTAEPVNEIYRPSIDVFFESVANYWNGDAVGVLLTGMGRDGAQGLKLMRQQGYLTIAQDQQSSAVYGMPKAAAAIDAAVEVRPLEKIASRLLEIFPK